MDGQYIVGKSVLEIDQFTDSVMVSNNIVGQPTRFSPVVIGGSSPYTYFWSGDDRFQSRESNPEFIYNTKGTYN